MGWMRERAEGPGQYHCKATPRTALKGHDYQGRFKQTVTSLFKHPSCLQEGQGKYRELKASPPQLSFLEGDGPNNPGNNFQACEGQEGVGNRQHVFMKENHAWPTS